MSKELLLAGLEMPIVPVKGEEAGYPEIFFVSRNYGVYAEVTTEGQIGVAQ